MWSENYFVNPIEKNLLRFHNFNVIEDITRAHVHYFRYIGRSYFYFQN